MVTGRHSPAAVLARMPAHLSRLAQEGDVIRLDNAFAELAALIAQCQPAEEILRDAVTAAVETALDKVAGMIEAHSANLRARIAGQLEGVTPAPAPAPDPAPAGDPWTDPAAAPTPAPDTPPA